MPAPQRPRPGKDLSDRERRAQPHHILPRSLFGGDEESNLVNLCPTHHTGPQGPHQLGHKAWFRRFQERLSDADCAKVRAALKLP